MTLNAECQSGLSSLRKNILHIRCISNRTRKCPLCSMIQGKSVCLYNQKGCLGFCPYWQTRQPRSALRCCLTRYTNIVWRQLSNDGNTICLHANHPSRFVTNFVEYQIVSSGLCRMPLRRGAMHTGKRPPDGNGEEDAVMVKAHLVLRNLSDVSKSGIIGTDKDTRYPDDAGYRAEFRICDQ